MKLIYVTFFFISFFSLVIFGINLNINKKSSIYLSLNKVEAFADSPEDKEAIYDKEKDTCEKTFTADGEGYIDIFGKRVKMSGIGANGKYYANYEDVQIDCPKGSKYYTCKECSCADFWQDRC